MVYASISAYCSEVKRGIWLLVLRLICLCHQDLPSGRVIRALEQIIEWRGEPKAIRCDNGPEYISHALQCWASNRGIRLDYIQPGKPQQNAYVERYNRTVRHEWRDMHEFETIEEAQMTATQWLWTYNNERPNMAIGGITPAMKLEQATNLQRSTANPN